MAKSKPKKEKKKIIKKSNVVLKKKKRKWVSILAPKEYGSIELGESFVSDAQDLKGRRLNVSLSNLGKGRNNNIKVIFEIEDVKEGKASTGAIGYYLLNSFSRRVVKKGRTKISEVFKFKSKDGVESVIKIVFSTQNRVPGSVSKVLRKNLKQEVFELFKKNSFDKVFDSVVGYKLQKELRKNLSKVFPVASLEIVELRKR